MKVHCSAQHFDHPSDAYRAFDCSCGGQVRPDETPKFSSDLSWYSVEGGCDKCQEPYFVLAVSKDSMMPWALKKIREFLRQVDKAGS